MAGETSRNQVTNGFIVHKGGFVFKLLYSFTWRKVMIHFGLHTLLEIYDEKIA